MGGGRARREEGGGQPVGEERQGGSNRKSSVGLAFFTTMRGIVRPADGVTAASSRLED